MGLPLHMNDCCSVKRVLFIDDANDIKVNQLIKNAGVLKRDINITVHSPTIKYIVYHQKFNHNPAIPRHACFS